MGKVEPSDLQKQKLKGNHIHTKISFNYDAQRNLGALGSTQRL